MSNSININIEIDPRNTSLQEQINQPPLLNRPSRSTSKTEKNKLKQQQTQCNYEEDNSNRVATKHRTKQSRENNKYICNFEGCKKQCINKSALRKHISTHNEKQFSCKSCNKKFVENSKLKRHSLVHSKEKNFRCDICDKKFSLDFNWKTHKRIHTGEKPYACIYPGCFKRFNQSSNWLAHEKGHKLWESFSNSKNNNNNNININSNNNEHWYTFERPVFARNPWYNLLSNDLSGTLTINNLIEINSFSDYIKNKKLNHFQPTIHTIHNSSLNSVNEIRSKDSNSVNRPFIINNVEKEIHCDSNQSNYLSWNKKKWFVIKKAKPLFSVHKHITSSLLNQHDTYFNLNIINNRINYINSNSLVKMTNNIEYSKDGGIENMDNNNAYFEEINYSKRDEDYCNSNNIISINEDNQNNGDLVEQNIENDDIEAGYFTSRNWK